jgi:hypothetical protein
MRTTRENANYRYRDPLFSTCCTRYNWRKMWNLCGCCSLRVSIHCSNSHEFEQWSQLEQFFDTMHQQTRGAQQLLNAELSINSMFVQNHPPEFFPVWLNRECQSFSLCFTLFSWEHQWLKLSTWVRPTRIFWSLIRNRNPVSFTDLLSHGTTTHQPPILKTMRELGLCHTQINRVLSQRVPQVNNFGDSLRVRRKQREGLTHVDRTSYRAVPIASSSALP